MSTPTQMEIIRAEIQRLWDERGRIFPADVVEAASDPSSPLHRATTWEWDDDAEAARHYRLSLAAQLIRSVKLRVTTTDASGAIADYKVRAFVAARHLEDAAPVTNGYVPSEVVRENPKMREALLRQMARDAQAFRRRYQHLAEYAAAVQDLLPEAQAS